MQHRYSEDLDFFSENEFDILNLDVFFNQIKREAGILKIDFQQSYNRNLFFLHFKGEVLKMEFTFFPFPRIAEGKREYGVKIDSLIDIAVNKLFTVYQRTKARDYVDLYFICKEKNFSIDNLVREAKTKFDWHIDPIQLGTQFIKSNEVKDYPKMIKKIPNEEWRNFFMNEAKKLKKKIIE